MKVHLFQSWWISVLSFCGKLIKNKIMTINKLFLTVLAVFMYLFISVWTFNHIDAWVGIGVFVLGLFISAKLIFKKQTK